MNLKSPGIKPRRQNQGNSNTISMSGTLPFSGKSHHTVLNDFGDQSPTGIHASSSSSAHEFSVFANVNIQGSSAFSQSQVSLSSIATNLTDLSADTISQNSSQMMAAPELPKRSNSIISLTNSGVEVKPIFSPRSADNAVIMTAVRQQPVVSPKCLDTLKEERMTPIGGPGTMPSSDINWFNNVPPTISPRTDKFSHQPSANDSSAISMGVAGTVPVANSAASTGGSTHNNTVITTTTERSPFQNTSQPRHISNSSIRNSTYNLRYYSLFSI